MEIITNSFKNHILPAIGKIKLKELDKGVIQQFLNGMKKSRVKEITTNYLKACITQAYKEEYLLKNPFDLVKTDKKIKSQKVGLYADEQEQLLNYLKENDFEFYKIIMCYLCTSCRKNELLTIEEKDISQKFVLIRGTKTANAVRYLKITTDFSKFLFDTLPIIKAISVDYLSKKFRRIVEQLKLKA